MTLNPKEIVLGVVVAIYGIWGLRNTKLVL